MTIHFSVKQRKKHRDYVFVDDMSVDCYENALFRVSFINDTLKKEDAEVVDEYLQTALTNLLEILNGSDDSSLYSGSHEDRIKALEDEILTLTNDINSQTPRHGTLKITPVSETMDFNEEGTMLKFTNADNGVYTTSILQDNVEIEIILPVGEYTINVVNSLNDMIDSIFIDLWENARSEDNGYTMKYNVVEGEVSLATYIDYEE